MKNLITLDTVMKAFISAVGYGVGYAIPDHYDCSIIICFISCFGLGMIADEIADKIISSRFIQKSTKNKYFVFCGMVAIFIAALLL